MNTAPPSPAQTGLSVQLYTVREALRADVSGTIARLAAMGLTMVEPFDFTAFPGLGAALAAHGMTAPTTHAHVLGLGAAARPVFEAAAELGVATVIDPYLPPDRWQSAADVARNAAELDEAAELAREFDLVVGYHNHAHELDSHLDGVTALDLLASSLSEAVVLEVDTYWAAVGGEDPVALLRRLGDRVVALHIKDGPITREPADQVAVGAGSMPVAAIVSAAPAALRVIELDDSRGDRFDAVAASVRFLTGEDSGPHTGGAA